MVLKCPQVHYLSSPDFVPSCVALSFFESMIEVIFFSFSLLIGWVADYHHRES